jgi:hypothetical protein
MRKTAFWVGLILLSCTAPGFAQVVLQEDFETGTFAPQWGLTTGVSLSSGTGALGSTRFARLDGYSSSSGRELGARLDSVASEGARDFSVDFFFRVQNTADRQFHLQVSTSAGSVGSSAPAISLRYQGAWAAYDGSTWQSLAALGTAEPNQWYRGQVIGRDWGLPSARWSVQVSGAGGSTWVASVTNLTFYQGGTPTANPARFFVFTSVFGNNPGFEVDNVFAEVLAAVPGVSNAVLNISGTYPHLAVFGTDGEIGIGAVMPWAGKLWFVTYPPHQPNGSPDKLWMLDTNLNLTSHPASVGCTDANRLVHRESQQLNIGHYLIDSNGMVRVISPAVMPGRLTGSARHLTDSANRIYIATMEEGLYEVDVNTLAVTQLYEDTNTGGPVGARANLPGQHGKGLYSAQGRVVYSNNGVGGSLSSWDGTNWTVVESNKFTEVTGPGGVYGNEPGDDRLWALGWDTRSVILRLLENGAWTRFRLPKGSYTHDADHGWYTEWPRIREIVDGKLLMHMHGLFYNFPKTFCLTNTAGIEPVCTYLKMPVDYCWWNGQLVMGRDDASTTGGNIWAGQSHSAPWFGQLEDLKTWGRPAGVGGVWLNDAVSPGVSSEAFLVRGFQRRVLHLKHTTPNPLTVMVQVDAGGSGAWTNLATVEVPPSGYSYYIFEPGLDVSWVRLVPAQAASGLTAYFHLLNAPQSPAPELFAGIAPSGATTALSGGIIRPQAGDARTLQFAATTIDAGGTSTTGYYEINGALQLARATNAATENTLRTTYALSNAPFQLDSASVVYVEGTNRFRLPRSAAAYDAPFSAGWPRGVREVVTERQMFQAHGTFYELPLSASGGFRRIRPITTHGLQITDYASWRGLLVIAGVANGNTNAGHVLRSPDGKAALWCGNVDDLWRMGAPRGVGGPWKGTPVAPEVPSDPYLMFGYDHKTLELSHTNTTPVTFTIEVDFLADNTWSTFTRIEVPPGPPAKYVFPTGYSAHWVRLRTDAATTATAQFTYGPAQPRITSAQLSSQGTLQLTFAGPEGWPYSLLSGADLSAPHSAWTAVSRGVFGPAAEVYESAGGALREFFRVSIP